MVQCWVYKGFVRCRVDCNKVVARLDDGWMGSIKHHTYLQKHAAIELLNVEVKPL